MKKLINIILGKYKIHKFYLISTGYIGNEMLFCREAMSFGSKIASLTSTTDKALAMHFIDKDYCQKYIDDCALLKNSEIIKMKSYLIKN